MSAAAPRAPSLLRRFASALYDALLVVALLFIATFPFLAFFGDATQGWRRHLLQAWIVFVVGAYFTWFWTRGGQTLPMKTWHMRLVTVSGRSLGLGRALWRYLLAIPGMLCGISLLWAPFDRERQFLHDRLAGTRIVRTDGERAIR